MADKSGVRFQFIDEQERQDPKSRLNSIIRSTARKYSLSARRSLNSSTAKSKRPIKAKEHKSVVIYTGNGTAGQPDGDSNSTEPSSREQTPGPGYRTHEPYEQSLEYATLKIQPNGAFVKWRLPSPKTMLGSGRSDPFDSFPVKMKPHMNFLLHYYTSVCAWSLPKQADGYTNSHTKWLPLCMKNEMAFKSTLLISETCSRSNAGLDPWSLFAMSLLVEIMELIRKEIDGPAPNVGDVMLATIINIARVELTHGDPKKYHNHMKGLNEILKLRGGLKSNEMDKFMREKVIWIKQLGGDFSSSFDNTNLIEDIPRDENSSIIDLSCCRSSGISDDLIGILKLIRFLTKTHTDSEARVTDPTDIHYRVKCLELQDELEKLHFEAKDSLSLEEACIVAAHIFLDLILLQTPAERIITGRMNGSLQGSLIHLSKARTSKENDDILLCKHNPNHQRIFITASGIVVTVARVVAVLIPSALSGNSFHEKSKIVKTNSTIGISATASAIIGSSRSRTLLVAVVDNFNRVLTRLEKGCLGCG